MDRANLGNIAILQKGTADSLDGSLNLKNDDFNWVMCRLPTIKESLLTSQGCFDHLLLGHGSFDALEYLNEENISQKFLPINYDTLGGHSHGISRSKVKRWFAGRKVFLGCARSRCSAMLCHVLQLLVQTD